ncbi:hypothetical protein Barb7_01683 [Bacteroidales bacterium Barb7]|nr:hypothetical protein Barb7_01683 [Bacteroidales bacterium Barb7]
MRQVSGNDSGIRYAELVEGGSYCLLVIVLGIALYVTAGGSFRKVEQYFGIAVYHCRSFGCEEVFARFGYFGKALIVGIAVGQSVSTAGIVTD